jgi:hypothetical protein
MAQKIADGITTAKTEDVPFGALLAAKLTVRFDAAGDLDVNDVPEAGTPVTGGTIATLSENTAERLMPVGERLQLVPKNGAEVTVWVARGDFNYPISPK